MENNKIIEASLLAFSKNIFKFLIQIRELKKNNINHIHYDVMDNKFVPNSAFNGEKINYLLKKKFIISVHLMVINVNEYVDKFLKFNVGVITFHCEPISNKESLNILQKIKKNNIKAGIAIKPNTNLLEIKNLILESDVITVMGVEPGLGGQKYIESTTNKLKELKNIIGDKNILVQLDGGVNLEVIQKVKNYVNLFISGTFLMRAKNKVDILKSLY